MVNKRLLRKAVVNAGGVTKFAQGAGVSAATVSRALARDDIVLRLCTVSKLRQGIKLYAAPAGLRDSVHGMVTCNPSITDHLLDVTAQLECWIAGLRCWNTPDERDEFAEIRDQFLELAVRAEQQELRCSGA